MQEELVGEVLDWSFEEGVCKGQQVVKKFADLAKRYKPLFIERGTEVLIMVPEEQEK